MFIKKEECDETLETVNKCECWLCLRVADVSDCVLFNETHKETLQGLLAKEVTNGLGSVVCNNCINKLDESFTFKSTCLYTEDNVTPLINSENFSKLDIITVFLEVHKDKTELLSKDSKVCRFCLIILENNSHTFLKDLSQLDLEILKKVTPEVQLEAVKDPIICEVCLYCFRDVLEFINMCLNALKWCDNSSWTNLNINVAHLDGGGSNFVSSEADSESSREPNDGSALNPKEIKRELDSSEWEDTTCLKIDHASDEESSQTFKCHVCGFVTMDEDSLAVHMNGHLSSEIKLDNFEESLTQSESKYNLTEHNLAHTEPVKVNFETEYQKTNEVHEKLDERKTYKCKLCQYSTKYKRVLVNHQRVHRDPDKLKCYKCQSCHYSSKYKGNLKLHQLVHRKPEEVQLYKCQLCQFSTTYKGNLRKHQLVHKKADEVKLHQCKLCQFSTKYKESLELHQIVHEKPGESKWYKCQLCQFRSKYKHSLESHQLVHGNPGEAELYKCHLCQFSTKHKRSLWAHQKVHEPKEANLFKCELCQFSTKYKKNLVTHKRVHVKPEEANLYKCELCEYSTKHKGNLRKHNLVHKSPDETTLYKCQLCQFSTKYKHVFLRHQIVHEKPEEVKLYKCELCPFSTKHNRSLTTHRKLHEPEEANLYKCELCQYSTKYKYGLVIHNRVHIKPDETSDTSVSSTASSIANINTT